MAEENGQPDSSSGHRSLGSNELTWALLDSGRGSQLPASILQIPWRSATRLARPRLVARLDADLRKSLTLISVSPGYGKTTLISESATRTDRRVAWAVLDADDKDPLRFWTHTAAVDVKHGKVLRLGSLPYTCKYKPEEFIPWKLETRGPTFEPLLKSMPSPMDYAYKGRAYSPNRIHHHSPPRRPKIRPSRDSRSWLNFERRRYDSGGAKKK